MGFAVRVRSAGQKYGPTCHQRDRADVTEFVTLVRLSSLGQHVGVLALAGYKRRKSALTAGPIGLAAQSRFPTFIMTQRHYVRTSATRYRCGDNRTKPKVTLRAQDWSRLRIQSLLYRSQGPLGKDYFRTTIFFPANFVTLLAVI